MKIIRKNVFYIYIYAYVCMQSKNICWATFDLCMVCRISHLDYKKR